MSQRMSRQDLERALRNQGIAVFGLIVFCCLLYGALLRKGVLSPRDLLADA